MNWKLYYSRVHGQIHLAAQFTSGVLSHFENAPWKAGFLVLEGQKMRPPCNSKTKSQRSEPKWLLKYLITPNFCAKFQLNRLTTTFGPWNTFSDIKWHLRFWASYSANRAVVRIYSYKSIYFWLWLHFSTWTPLLKLPSKHYYNKFIAIPSKPCISVVCNKALGKNTQKYISKGAKNHRNQLNRFCWKKQFQNITNIHAHRGGVCTQSTRK